MRIVRFTKFWPELRVEEMGQRAAALGYDGFDLALRPGHPINPDNMRVELPRAMQQWRLLSLECPLITADVSCIDAEQRATRALFQTAGEAGVEAIKLGYFQFRPGEKFQDRWDEARRALDGFEALARETGVRALCHTHSGLCLGSNCAGLRHLLEGFDPAFLGAYPDLGHLAVNGEDARMGLAMLHGRIGAVAAKDARHVENTEPNARSRYVDAFVMLGDGAAEIESAIGYLAENSLDVPISVHTEYTADQSVIETVGGLDLSEQAERLRQRGERADLAFLRALEDPSPR